MKELAGSNITEVTEGKDNVTGLKVFMVAAMGDRVDVNTIYNLVKIDPGYFDYYTKDLK